MLRNVKIKTKIILLSALIFILLMGASSLISTKISFGILLDRIVTKEAPVNTKYIAEVFEKKIAKAITLGKIIGDNPFIHKWIQKERSEKATKKITAYFKTFMEEGLSMTFLVSNTTLDFYTQDGFFKTLSKDVERDSWYFDTLASGKKVGINIQHSETNGDLTAYVNVIMGTLSYPIGVAGVGISLTQVSKDLKNFQVSDSSVAYLISEDGGIKAHPDKSYVSEIKNIKNIPDQNYKKNAVHELLNNTSGMVTYEDISGCEKLIAFSSIPSTGWKIVIEAPKKEFGKGLDKIIRTNAMVLVVFIILLIVILNATMQTILKPINETILTLEDISEGEGDLTKRLKVSSSDEASLLSLNINKFMDKLQQMIKRIAEHTDYVNDSSSGLEKIATTLAQNSHETYENSGKVTTAAQDMTHNINMISNTLQTASENVTQVAAATEEMKVSITEIASRSSNASEITGEAVMLGEESFEQIQTLGKSALNIANVVSTITDISEQTNLLALNAAIEAARAGVVGKGFAVVANEIKALSTQTNEATEDIKSSIKGIRKTADVTISYIERVSQIINTINDIVSSIAAAVEEQSATTGELSETISNISLNLNGINGNVTEIATVSEKMTSDIDGINKSASHVSDNSMDVLKNSEGLKELSLHLKAVVDQFKV